MEIEYTGGYGISIDCAFEPGKSVSFFYTGKDKRDSLTMVPGSCFIQRIDQKRMIVSVPDITFPTLLARLAEKNELGIQLGIDETTYDVMESALQRAMDRDGEKWVHLRDTLTGKTQPAFRELPALHFPNLNASQNEAVNRIVRAREVAVVHGPPGTGKTTTLVELSSLGGKTSGFTKLTRDPDHDMAYLFKIGYVDMANFVHEITHCGQFLNGKIGFQETNDGFVAYVDIYDELDAYKSQYYCNQNSLPRNNYPVLTVAWLYNIKNDDGDYPYRKDGRISYDGFATKEIMKAAYPKIAKEFDNMRGYLFHQGGVIFNIVFN